MLTWKSSDESVAIVDDSGLVTAVKEGTATITATTPNDLTATCEVTVKPLVIDVTGLTIDKTILSLTEGETATLSATVSPENATDKTVTWTSSEATVASVNTTGVVTALKAGTATITVSTANGLTATCDVTIKAATVEASGLTLNLEETELVDGKTVQLEATVTPSDATDKSVTWTSSDVAVASVNASGLVTALKPGKATITASTANGLTATCEVTVVPRTETVGGLVYEIVPGGGADGGDAVKLIGGDPDDDGVIRIPEEVEIDGKIYLVTEIGDGAFKNRTDIAKVVIPPTVVTVGDEAFAGCTNLREVEAEDGEKLLSCGTDAFKDCPIEELYLGRDTSGKPFAGNSALESVTIGDKVASIGSGDFEGCTSIVAVTVLNPTPLALADDGFEQRVYAQATLMVPDDSVDDYKAASGWKNFYDILGINEIRPVDIEFELANRELVEGKAATLKVIITPENATDKSVTWTSSDEAVATVNASGLVTALKPGKATITASTANALTATCEVTVVAATVGASGVELNIEEAEIVEGESVQLEATVLPSDVTDKSVAWTSSDETVATVNASGLVAALKAGTTTITATTANGLKATCTVTVTPKPSGIEGVDGDGVPAVSVEGGEIVISGDAVAEVYSLTGARVAVANGGRISGLPRGIYLVRTGGKTYKIVL